MLITISKKPIEQYVDTELERAIKSNDSLLRFHKTRIRIEDPVGSKLSIDANVKIEEEQIRLYAERNRRILEGKYPLKRRLESERY